MAPTRTDACACLPRGVAPPQFDEPGGSAFRACPGFAFNRSGCDDADEAAERLHAWDQVYRQLSPGRFEGLTTEIWLDSIQLFRERSNRRVHQAGRAWAGAVTFGIPLAIGCCAHFCGQAIGLDSLMVLEPGSEMDFLTSTTLDLVGISIPHHRLPAFDAEARRGHNRLIAMKPPMAARMRALVRSLFDTIESDPQRLAAAGVRTQIRDDLIEGLAGAIDGAGDTPIHPSHHPSRRALVQRATDYALAHADETLSVERLCEVLGVSRRSLQYAFERTLGCSPLEYLRTIRLHAVRSELKATPRSVASIQDIAARWGFWHLGHFGTRYRQLFGCRPSETPRPA